jgi:hypothetical protein
MAQRPTLVRLAALGVACAAVLGSWTTPAHATIHPIIQSVNCAAAAAWAQVDVGDPPGQTPAGFAGENITMAFPFLTITFPQPLTFDQSDFRALIATGFIDQVVVNASGQVTALVVDLRDVPMAASGQGGAHCSNA